MSPLNGCIQVLRVQAEPQPFVLLSVVNKASNPLCRLTIFDLGHIVISNHLV